VKQATLAILAERIARIDQTNAAHSEQDSREASTRGEHRGAAQRKKTRPPARQQRAGHMAGKNANKCATVWAGWRYQRTLRRAAPGRCSSDGSQGWGA